MSTQVKKPESPATLPPAEQLEKMVVDYLGDHPDFFDHHPELLRHLELSHGSGEAVSLMERQVRALRQESNTYRSKLEALINIARENERLNDRLHNLTLTLLDTLEFEEVIDALEDKLHDEFDAEAVELHLFSEQEMEGGTNPELNNFRELIDACKPACGRHPKVQIDYLFGTQAEDIRSAALIPLRGDGILGILAIGSRDDHRFHPEMGTDYLARLGEIVGKTLEVVSEPGF